MTKFDFIATDVLIEEGEGFTDVIEFTASDIELYEGEVLELSDVLKEYTKTIETTTFTTSMQEIEAKFEGKHDLQGEELQFELGARETYLHPSSENEWLNFGTFKVVETEYDDASNETTIVAYDNMIKFHVDYSAEEMGLSYPQSIYNILKRTCEVVGVELATHDFFNKLKRVEEDKWGNRGQVTYRNVLDDVAEATLSYIYIQDNKLHVAPYNETNEVISEENLSDLVVGDKYGAVNMLNLTREPQHDNLVRPTNWTDIPRDERVEIVIDTNQIMDKRREDYIDGLYERIKGFEYYPFEAKSFGYGFFNAGDKVTVKDVDGNEYTSYIHKSVLKVTNGLSEELSSDIPKQAKEEYAVVTDQQRKDIRTYLIVDQQNGKIEGLVEDIGGLEDKQSKFEQSLDEISLKVEGLNNNANIIPNLNGNLENYLGWEFENTRSAPFIKGMPFRQFMPFNVNFEIKALDNSLSQWGLSFFASGTAITGMGYVVPTQVYSFRAKRHKGTQPFSVTVKQYDKDKKHLRDRKMSFESPSNYEAFTIKLMDDVRYVRLAFGVNATPSNRLELTEMMFNRGNPKEWQESAGDVKLFAQSELKVLDDEIRSTVEDVKVVDGKVEQSKSQITQLASEIDLKVEKDGIIGGINASPETVKIKSNRLEFDNAVGKNVDLSGKITANSGKVGAYGITSNSLKGNNIELKSDSINVGNATISSTSQSGSYFLHLGSKYILLGDSPDGFTHVNIANKPFTVDMPRGDRAIYVDTILHQGNNGVIGSDQRRYHTIFLKNQPNVSSDIRHKSMIEDIPQDLLERLSNIKPKQYVQNGKVHFGYIAQDVERELYKYCVNKYGWKNAQKAMEQYAFLYKSESHLSLLYGEIAVLKDAQREEEIKELKEEVQELKGMLKEVLNGL